MIQKTFKIIVFGMIFYVFFVDFVENKTSRAGLKHLKNDDARRDCKVMRMSVVENEPPAILCQAIPDLADFPRVT